MKFHFLNITEATEYLHQNAANFRSRYPTLEEGVAFIKQQAVSLFIRHCAGAKTAQDVNDGVLHVPVWRNMGATFHAVGKPNTEIGDDYEIPQELPEVIRVEVNLWISLPLE